MIAGTLKGVISQRLVPGADGGRVAVCEILRMTGRARDMIVDPDQTGKLLEVITEGGYYGMQTFDQALYEHVKAGRVTVEDALALPPAPTTSSCCCRPTAAVAPRWRTSPRRRTRGAPPAGSQAPSPAVPRTAALAALGPSSPARRSLRARQGSRAAADRHEVPMLHLVK